MIRKAKPRGERGQTIILVAVSIVSLLAMAALAIDVVTLYVASSEIKRAADAAALAGAKGIADSGVTTLQATDPDLSAAQTLAQNMANAAINAMLPVNTVAAAAPTCTNCPITPNWNAQGNYQGNPTITVSLQRTGLPTFFARIWGRTGSTVSASATAEVYNPSNSSTYTPIAPTAVKPWLVADVDPTTGVNFIDSSGGSNQVELKGAIGETFDLTADCPTGCNHNDNPPVAYPSALQVDYVPVAVTPNTGNNVCPSCSSGSDFEMSIACADVTTVYSCGTSSLGVIPPGFSPGDSATGAECLTHAASYGLGQGQDQLTYPLPPAFPPFPGPPQIQAGTYAPYSGLASTSVSIVTIPIITGPFPPQGSVNIVGFMQAFINDAQGPGAPNNTANDINITVLNIAGCNGSSNGNPPVVGGTGTSPVPVRLIAGP